MKAGDMSQTEAVQRAMVRAQRQELRQRAADEFWNVVYPSEAESREYRRGFYEGYLLGKAASLSTGGTT